MSILVSGLLSELNKPSNLIFKNELEQMHNICQQRLKLYLDNDFLLLSSLLDPRYTTEVEAISNKQFNTQFSSFIKLANKFREHDLTFDETGLSSERVGETSEEQIHTFWGTFGQQNLSDTQNSSTKEYNNCLEVTILII